MKGFDYTRPMPPERMQSPAGFGFVRAENLEHFVQTEFLHRGGIFWDAEHGHLGNASIGFVWAGSRCRDRGSEKAGQARLLKAGEISKWGEAMQYALLHALYGHALPTFLITLHAPTCWAYTDREFFALVDHELSHCAIARDRWGAPRFSDATGEPVWAIRPHDLEQFTGTTERWGASAAGAAELVAAGNKRPRFDWVPGKDLDPSKVCAS